MWTGGDARELPIQSNAAQEGRAGDLIMGDFVDLQPDSTNIRGFWTALAQKSRSLNDERLSDQIETIGRLNAKFDRDGARHATAKSDTRRKSVKPARSWRGKSARVTNLISIWAGGRKRPSTTAENISR